MSLTIKSTRPLTVKRRGAMPINITVTPDGVDVSREVAEYLVGLDPTEFSVAGAKPGPEKQPKSNKEWSDKLEALDKIGKKTAQDIAASFLTEKELRDAIAQGATLPFRDDVAEVLKDAFGEETKK